jgi:ABC-type nickel/cobalt efflux system permease component RcnA
VLISPLSAAAHPLGNFTVNHFARLEIGNERVRVRYVVDSAEIPAFQELQTISGRADGQATDAQLRDYARRVAPQHAENLVVTLDGARLPLSVANTEISLPPGQGNLPTLRLVCDYEAALPARDGPRRLRFEDKNYLDRIGWREIVARPAPGVAVFDSTAYGNALTDELRAYPEDRLAAPLNERQAELSFAPAAPPNASPLRARDGKAFAPPERDRFAELINAKELSLGVVLLSLLLAAFWGGAHALSPGHGKTVVGAYLVGARGTAKHAAFLGLTVTVTHTSSVVALGLVALFASHYVLPEKLLPLLSLASGLLVLGIGLQLFSQRLRAALGYAPVHDHHHHEHGHEHAHGHQAAGSKRQEAGPDSSLLPHPSSLHSHLPPGADDEPVTWRSLLALGVSGGLVPCPSALVMMLSAITLGRIGFGLVLVVAFSVGLAATLTAIGLAFVYAGRALKDRARNSTLVRVVPVLSALVIACLGAVLCYQSLHLNDGLILNALSNFWHAEEPSFQTLSARAILGLGLLYGLKHATEADHVVAVSTIVSEHRNLLRAALVGAWWGTGHTLSLVVAGAFVLALRVAIPEQVAGWLEFGVALMIIGLGANAVWRAWQRREEIHVHQHQHDGVPHAHVHLHEAAPRIGWKPLLVGAMHGLAGSAALTVLVLTQISSPLVGMFALLVFGVGSIIGMLLMSGLVGLPFALSAQRLTRMHFALQFAAGLFSVAFGLWYAYGAGR